MTSKIAQPAMLGVEDISRIALRSDVGLDAVHEYVLVECEPRGVVLGIEEGIKIEVVEPDAGVFQCIETKATVLLFLC